MYKKIFLISVIIALFLIAGCTSNSSDSVVQKSTGTGPEITVFKSQYCGCCVGYVAELERNNFNVEVIEKQDLSSIKDQYGIPADLQSCHTAVVDDYFIEGHVPIEAVNKLLAEQPDIDGIGLAGMPSGTLGMPGPKREDWQIYALKDGVKSEFMII